MRGGALADYGRAGAIEGRKVRIVALAVALLVAGCTTLPEKAYIPTPVPCRVVKPQEPVFATSTLTTDSDIFQQARALVAEIGQRMAYEKLLNAAIDGCNYDER